MVMTKEQRVELLKLAREAKAKKKQERDAEKPKPVMGRPKKQKEPVEDTFEPPVEEPMELDEPKMKVDDVLREMQKRREHMAVIQSKEGKIIGVVTLEDLIEEIFGEIRDEHDIK